MTNKYTAERPEKDGDNLTLGLEGSTSQQGRAGGNLQRDVATQEEEKRTVDKPEGTTRVTGEDKRNHGESA